MMNQRFDLLMCGLDINWYDDHDIIYVIHVTYIKAWAAGVGASSLKVLINDDVSVSLNIWSGFISSNKVINPRLPVGLFVEIQLTIWMCSTESDK